MATLAAIICLWVAVDRRNRGLLVLAGVAITAAFLTKALTAYAFYGAAGLILRAMRNWRFLILSPPSLIIHACIIGFAPLWIFAIAGWGQNARLIGDITARAHTGGFGRYILSLVAYWGEMLLRLLPLSALWLALVIRPGLRSSEDPCPR